MIAYQDPSHPSYHGTKVAECYGCGEQCAKSSWGPWYHSCNVKRLDRIGSSLRNMVERAKFDEAVRAAVISNDDMIEHLLNQRNAILRAAGGKVTATKEQHRPAGYWGQQSHVTLSSGSETDNDQPHHE